jgi:hypothetical protein
MILREQSIINFSNMLIKGVFPIQRIFMHALYFSFRMGAWASISLGLLKILFSYSELRRLPMPYSLASAANHPNLPLSSSTFN